MKLRLAYIIGFLTVCVGLAVARRGNIDCSGVRESFSQSPSVAETIFSTPSYDADIQLCRFTNHTETRRKSCCSHTTEQVMLREAKHEFQNILIEQSNSLLPKLIDFSDHMRQMLMVSQRMTEYEVGTTLSLHHSVGRDLVQNFFGSLRVMVLDSERAESIFRSMDTFQDQLFVYVIREASNPGSRQDFTETYASCVQENRRKLSPSPFSVRADNLRTSLHYSAIAASFLQESLGLTRTILNMTAHLELSDHCFRDLVKLNHCQKCYGLTMDVFMVCLNKALELNKNWGYHMEIMKIISKYISEKVDIQLLLNGFATEINAAINYAIMEYPNYRSQLASVCGSPEYKPSHHNRLKIWEKPTQTSYDGDFTGDLRRLYITLENDFKGFYEELPLRICETEPNNACWDGLTERRNKKKLILEFKDQFAPYPDPNPDLVKVEQEIKRIRKEVLKIFLSKPKSPQNTGDSGDLEGSGSGGGEITDDNEEGDVPDTGAIENTAGIETSVNIKHSQTQSETTVTDIVHEVKPIELQPESAEEEDLSIEHITDAVLSDTTTAKQGSQKQSDKEKIKGKAGSTSDSPSRLHTSSQRLIIALSLLIVLFL